MGHGGTRNNGSARIRKEKRITTKDTKYTKEGKEITTGEEKTPALLLEGNSSFHSFFLLSVLGVLCGDSFLSSDPC
jgi:hypothetical protein